MSLSSSFILSLKKTSPSLTFVRWYRWRKPLWLGRAKSKMFVIPPEPDLPEADKEELQHLVNCYKTEFKSIKQFCHTEYYLKASATSETAIKKQEEENEELLRLLQENEAENQRIAAMREQYMANNAAVSQKTLQEEMLKYYELRERKIEQAKREIDALEILVQAEITPEKLDAAIERALETVVDYDYAISLDGKIHGRQEQQQNESEVSS